MRSWSNRTVCAAAALILVLCCACGGSGGSSGQTPTTPTPPAAPPVPSPAPTPPPTRATVTITAAGTSPKEVRILKNGVVTFANTDARIHYVTSDPVFIHTDCPTINDVGLLTPGQSRDTGAFATARTCGYHDHTDESNTAFQGTIVIEEP
jgi:hypothetical protein